MFENLLKRFNPSAPTDPTLQKDAVAELLRISPEALAAFEAAYAAHTLEEESENFFETNSRQAVKSQHAVDSEEKPQPIDEIDYFENLCTRIVNELLAQTVIYVFDGNLVRINKPLALPEGTKMVSNAEINRLPERIRPQLAGELMKVDIGEKAYPHLLWLYQQSKTAKTEKQRLDAYHHFRQGLDILDLDPVTYEMLSMNPNSMGYWLPKLVEACRGQDFFKIPATTIAKVPMTLLQLTRLDYTELTPTTLQIVDRWAHEAFDLNDEKEYFIKTGTYSSKFDFRNTYVHGTKEVKELGEYLPFIHHQALQMASPLCMPCIYGVSTTNEWVVREFIHDKESNPCIYKGLPLHTEYRVFVDADEKTVIGISPYWEPKTMKKRFGHEGDVNSPHQIHDYVIYKAHENVLMERYYKNKDVVLAHIESILPELDLHGQWSIDVMQNGEDFWIIDMALAENSAFYECVPGHLRVPSPENWIPKLPG